MNGVETMMNQEISFVPLTWDHIPEGTRGDSYQFGLVMDIKNRLVRIVFNTDYIHKPSGVTHAKGKQIELRACPTRGYLDFFVAGTWVINNGSNEHLPSIPLIAKKIDDKEIVLVYGDESEETGRLVYKNPSATTSVGPHVILSGHPYRAYYPHSDEGELAASYMKTITP